MTKEKAIQMTKARIKVLKASGKTGKQEAAKALELLLELSQERPKGQWSQETYKIADFNITYFVCSNCKHSTFYGIGGFCPNCGADMRGKQE